MHATRSSLRGPRALGLAMIFASACTSGDDDSTANDDGSTSSASDTADGPGPTATTGTNPTTPGPSGDDTTGPETDGSADDGSADDTDVDDTDGDGTDADDTSADDSTGGPPPVDVEPGTLAAFLANDLDGGINVLTIDDGVGTLVAGSPFNSGGRTIDVVLVGDRLFATELPQFDPHVFTYDVDVATGAVALVSETSAGSLYGDIIHHPVLSRVYVSAINGARLDTFAAADDGTLTVLGMGAVSSEQPRGLDISADGTHVFAATADGLETFAVQGDGSLMPALSTKGPIAEATGVAVTDDGTCVFVGSSDGVAAATLDGGEATLAADTYDPGSTYRAVRTLPANDDATQFIVASGNGGIATFRIDADCALTMVGMHDSGMSYISELLPVEGGYIVAGSDGASSVYLYGLSPGGGIEPLDGSPFEVPEFQLSVALMQL